MATPRLVFDHVTKSFRDRTTPRTLRDQLGSTLNLLSGRREAPRTRFVALDDVSIEVQAGEALGFIGHNGAGKTTSLKLAAGIYRPDAGHVHAEGPIASMIELSAGFHPDLSGRENIFLNAALLGLRRKEIQKLLGQIIDFSGVADFIDAPLRVYSTGMEVRLGFAVAAHVPANLLLVDEVLAVGDLDFRARCLDRMAERRREGVSVLFVSHQLSIVESFCDRAVVIERGKKIMDGQPAQLIDSYRRRILSAPGGPLNSPVRQVRRGTGDVTITRVEFFGPKGAGDEGEATDVAFGAPFSVRLHLEAAPQTPAPTLGIQFHAQDGTVLAETQSRGDDPVRTPLGGPCTVEIEFPDMTLLPGAYAVSVYARDREGLSEWDVQEKAHTVAVFGDRPDDQRGLANLRAHWQRS